MNYNADMTASSVEFSADAHRRVAVLSRVGMMLRRKVGHEREDKAYDSLMRSKTLHIVTFSMGGIVAMVAEGCITWYTGEFRTDTRWEDAHPTVKTVMLCLQIVITFSTIVTMFLIAQYYRLQLLNKRKEWSKVETDIVSKAEERAIERSYSFWSSSWLRFTFTLEILVHAIHPVFLFQDLSGTFFTLCQIFMFSRMYLFGRVLHTFSRPYKLRIEIINSNREFQTMNLRIKMGLTLKMLFYSRTVLVLFCAFCTSIAVFSFMIFLVERTEQRDEFGRLENVFWFSFITFTTIGFGDFVPKTLSGRILTVLLSVTGVIITSTFSGVLTNKLAPTKIQRFVVEYLKVREALDIYREKAAILIQASFKSYLKRKRRTVREAQTEKVGHKSNQVYGAVKEFRRARSSVKGAVLPAMDPVLQDKVTQLNNYLRDLDEKLTEQQYQMKALQSKIDDELAAIMNMLAR
ncbi:Potassium voltage-gated channel protein Shab [Diplonema papillatum]|nr:Potassium voltage-gated channel protein Shab [Diplonema papillatum]